MGNSFRYSGRAHYSTGRAGFTLGRRFNSGQPHPLHFFTALTTLGVERDAAKEKKANHKSRKRDVTEYQNAAKLEVS